MLAAFDAETRAAGGVVWGSYDCLHLAIEGAGRADLLALIPRYRSKRDAMVALQRRGFADPPAALDSVGARIPVAHAIPGDPAMTEGPEGDALGVVCGPLIGAFIQPGGGLRRTRPFVVWRLHPCRTPLSPS